MGLYQFYLGILLGSPVISIGLGTSTSKEAKEYFAEMTRHRIPFKYSGPADDAAITLVGKLLLENGIPDFIAMFCYRNYSSIRIVLCLTSGFASDLVAFIVYY